MMRTRPWDAGGVGLTTKAAVTWRGWVRMMQHFAPGAVSPYLGAPGSATSSTNKFKKRFVVLLDDARLLVFASNRVAPGTPPKAALNLLQATGVCLLNAAASAPRGLGLPADLMDDEHALALAGDKIAIAEAACVTVMEGDQMHMASLVSELAHHVRAASVIARGYLHKRSSLMWKKCVARELTFARTRVVGVA